VNALRELTGGDAEFERELIETFVASGDKCLKEIVAALRTSDFDTIGKRAHASRARAPTSTPIGSSAAASSLESAARASSLREIGGLVQEVTEKLQAVNAQLRKAG
jgi:HPt (histidine-containing phosphotransfer) domain-containing protein